MDARMSGGPSTIAEDAARDMAGEEAGVKRRTEGFPCQSRLVLCEAAKGIILCWVGFWGKPRGPPKATIRGNRETGALPVLLLVESSMIGERIASWVGETTRVRMEKLHAGCLVKGR